MRNIFFLIIATLIQLIVKTQSSLISTQLKTLTETANQVEILQGSSKYFFNIVPTSYRKMLSHRFVSRFNG